jgi:uncharacterized protein with HEPN domain
MSRDDAYLLDMLLAARDAQAFVADLTRMAYDRDRRAQYAVAHALQVIGEAAARVSQPTRQAIADVPWPEIIGMRNRLVHDYGRVDHAILWNTVERDLPRLILELERALGTKAKPPRDAPP